MTAPEERQVAVAQYEVEKFFEHVAELDPAKRLVEIGAIADILETIDVQHPDGREGYRAIVLRLVGLGLAEQVRIEMERRVVQGRLQQRVLDETFGPREIERQRNRENIMRAAWAIKSEADRSKQLSSGKYTAAVWPCGALRHNYRRQMKIDGMVVDENTYYVMKTAE